MSTRPRACGRLAKCSDAVGYVSCEHNFTILCYSLPAQKCRQVDELPRYGHFWCSNCLRSSSAVAISVIVAEMIRKWSRTGFDSWLGWVAYWNFSTKAVVQYEQLLIRDPRQCCQIFSEELSYKGPKLSFSDRNYCSLIFAHCLATSLKKLA